HPVGYEYNPSTGRAEMNGFAAVMFNKVQLVTFPHVVLSAYMTGAAFVVGVALWHLRRARTDADRALYRPAVRTGAWLVLVAALGVVVTGDVQGKIMTEVQPMKMAAAEGLYETEGPADFSVFQLGTLDGEEETFSIKIPGLLSFLATGTPNGEVEGINELRERYQEQYGADPGAAYYSPGDYTPVIPLTYWSFRLMIGLGTAGAAVAAWVLWATRAGRTPQGRAVLAAAVGLPFLPLFANSFGWIFTEMGRQPWAVFGLMTTEHSVSPGLTTTEAWISLLTLTAVYGLLAVVEIRLLLTWIRRGADELPDPLPDDAGDDRPLAFAY
ncbi:MAG TPA: cytochrome ubiquinol oxidase subunit I, partial [Nocardioides sp.]|nr:cytochrome ubiquinol oxidase subunit I [Nocardioides sp.]